MRGPRRPRTRARRLLSPRVGFLLRLFATYLGVLVLVGSGLYWVQATDARAIVTDDAAVNHLQQARLIEGAHASARGEEDPWDEVSEVLSLVGTVPGVEDALVISAAGEVMAASEVFEMGGTHDPARVAGALASGELLIETKTVSGRQLLQLCSPVTLGGRRYLFAVELEPVVLTAQLAALQRSSLQHFGASVLIALPLLYLLGGRGLAARYSDARDLAARDGLTGLKNHRSFHEALRQEVECASRAGQALTLALVDLDDFKVVNDRDGHRRGDEVLVEVARTLRSAGSPDHAYRVGGDEFALLVPGTGLAGASALLEALAEAARARLGGTTVSVGAAELLAGEDAEALRDRADAALYEAKRRGRDRVVSAHEVVGRDGPALVHWP